MSRKVLRKTRTGQWVVAAIALLAVGGAAASAIPSSQETTVSNSGSSTISSKDKTSESSSTSAKTTDTKTATETSGDSVSDAAKEVVENVAAAIAAVNNSQDNTTPVAAAIAEAPKPVIPAGQDTPATKPVQPNKPSDGRVAELQEAPADLISKIKPAKPADKPEQPATPAKAPAEPTKPETPAKPVETPKAPEDTTTVVSKDEKPAAIPDPEVKPGGEVIGSEDTKTSDKTVTGEKPATPVDTPATPGGTDTNVTPGDTVITKPEVPATPAVPGTDEVKDDQGNVVTPGTPETPAVPAQPAETKRTDVVVDVTTINYGTTYVKDTTLKSGETKLITPGVNGTTTVTTNVDYVNDVEVGRTVVSSVTVDPINEVMAYNDEAEVLREEVIETLNTIAYGTERHATTDLEEGQERVVTKGVNGQTKTTTKHVYDANGNLVTSEDLGTVTVTEAVNEVIEYGVRAKDVIEVVEERTSTELDYQTETRETDQFYKGETRVVTKGIKGYVVNVAKVTKTNGVETAREVTEGERVDPVTEVIEVGTKDRVEVTSATRTEAIDFQTETRQNDQLDKGETRVITQGVKGQRVIKTTTTTTNGVPVTTEEVVSETAPVTHVVEVGTREKTETSTRQVVEEIDFQTITRQNPDLKKGEQRIVTQGVKGRKVTEITTITVGGTTIEDSKVIENTAPVNQVIEVGTKEDIRYDMRVEREEIAFKTVTRQTDALFEDETREVTPGTNGRKATTYRDTYVDGVKVGSEIVGEPVVVEAVDRVIEVGTRKEQTTASVTNTEVLNFTTVTENDPNLEVGQTRIRVNGVNGQRVVRITRVTNNRTGEVTETREVISETAPVNEVLVVGTKPASDSLLDKKTLTLDEFMSLTEEQQDAFIAKKGTVPGTTIRTGATKDTLEKVEQLINLDKLNAEFISLLNAALAAEGLSAVTYAGQGSDVQSAATARANELADHGSLRYQGTPNGAHKRPDGSNWTTIYTAEQTSRQGWRGENALQLGSALSAYSLFNEWMNSAGHKAVMMKNLDNLQVAVGIGLNDKAIETTFRNGVTVAMLELVQPKP
jgi:uncharacterized protein YabE (DUF348 family)